MLNNPKLSFLLYKTTNAPSINSFFNGSKTKPETKEESILLPVLKTSLVFFAGLPSVISLTPSAKFNI